MRTMPARSIDPELEAEIARMLHEGDDQSRVVHVMRLRGLDKVESMKMLRDHAGISLAEAKRQVHLSPAWSDRRASDDALHETACKAALDQESMEQESKLRDRTAST